MKDIIGHINKARIEAQKQLIKANMIILDEDLAIAEHLLVDNKIIPPMIMGLEVKYLKNLTQDLGCHFIMTDGLVYQDRLKELEVENEILRSKLKRIEEVLKNETKN